MYVCSHCAFRSLQKPGDLKLHTVVSKCVYAKNPPQTLRRAGFDHSVILVFGDRVSLYSPGYPGTHFVDQAGLKLRNSPASVSQVVGLKTCTTTAPLLLSSCFLLIGTFYFSTLWSLAYSLLL